MPQTQPLRHGLLPLLTTVLGLVTTLVVWHSSVFWPALTLGAISAALVARSLGMQWGAIGRAAAGGAGSTWIAISILLQVGAIIGVWKASGTVPALVYYGLQLLNPHYLVPAAFLLALATSMLLGTSIGTLSTLGIGIMGVAHAAGSPMPLVAGALVSGALFGDRSSPLSSSLTLNLTMTGTSMQAGQRAMAPTGVLAATLSLAGYWLLGSHAASAASSIDSTLRMAIGSHYAISLWLLLPPVAVLVLALARVPVRIALGVGIAAGMVLAAVAGGQPLLAPVRAALLGNAIHSGNGQLDQLFAGGGLVNMLSMIALLLAAGAMNGIMEESGLMTALITRATARIRRPTALVAATMATSVAVAALAANQALAIIVPGRMLLPAYEAAGLPSTRLSRALADSGTVMAGLMPWNLLALMATAALGVPVRSFAPYVLLGWLLPLISLGWTLLERPPAAPVPCDAP